MTTQATEVETPINPLVGKEITVFHTWNQWLENFNRETSLCSLYGEMQGVFQEEQSSEFTEVDRIKRIVFFLNLADGWNKDLNHFTSPGELRDVLQVRRKKLSKKAFALVCKHIFSFSDCFSPSVMMFNITNDRDLFEAVLRFFRVEISGSLVYSPNINVEDREQVHNMKIARNFATEFAKFIWYYWFGYYGKNVDDEILIWCVDILSSLRKLDEINTLTKVSSKAILRLEELARIKTGKSLRHALISGSDEAWLAKKLSAFKGGKM